MNFFSKSTNKSSKKTKNAKISSTEESSSPRLRSQSRENTACKPKVSKKKSDSNKQTSTSHRTLRSSNKASTSSHFSFDLDSHPLNLPPDQRRKLSTLSKMSDPERMDEDTELSDAAPNSSKSQASPTALGDTPKINDSTTATNQNLPVPPPHRSNASSPIVITTTSDEDGEIYKTAGNKYYKAKEYDKAIAEYSKAVVAQPSSATYLSNRAAAYISNGQYTQALDDCLQASQLDPQNSKILLRLARIYTNLGRPQEALDVYSRMDPPASVKDVAPSKTMLQHIKGVEDSLKHSTTGSMAIHALDQAEKLLGPGAEKPRKWQLMRGEALLKMGNENSLGNAQNIAMSLLRTNSADPEALVLRGRILYAQGDNTKAVSHLRQAISCDPDYREAVKYLRIVQKLERTKSEGNSEYKSGKYKEAISKYTEALEIDPLNKGTNSKLLQNRALCHIRLRSFNAAISDCEQAIALDPSYIKAKKTKATAVGQSGDWESAIREWKELLERDPQNPSLVKELRAAEMEQKKSKRKDYYKILGLEKDADQNQIKKAYRKAAIVHHPDKNPDDESAAERFKDIGEAYETLSDPEKRARYDNGDDLVDPTEAFGGGMQGMQGMQGMGIDPEILMQMFGAQMGGGARTTFSFGGDTGRHRGPPPGFTFR